MADVLNKWSVYRLPLLVCFRPREGQKQTETGTLRQRLPLAAPSHPVGEVAGSQAVAATFRNRPLRKD